MRTGSTHIKAKLTLYSTEHGGRLTGIGTGYRPNHVFEYNKKGEFIQSYIGQINFENEKLILPGETDIVTVEFLNLFGIEELLTIGRKWWIHEAARRIGEAEIIQIYDTI